MPAMDCWMGIGAVLHSNYTPRRSWPSPLRWLGFLCLVHTSSACSKSAWAASPVRYWKTGLEDEVCHTTRSPPGVAFHGVSELPRQGLRPRFIVWEGRSWSPTLGFGAAVGTGRPTRRTP
ncbi:hypothetical protein U9M48_032928 [Paspalum notatum var. saurae]|uniref:Secreted protein n=1 Tax=Paspalum notatum var. saurae TaxID=547442 RepID=A0AAQ3U669_PASNO